MAMSRRNQQLDVMYGRRKHYETGASLGDELTVCFVLLPCFAARTVNTKRDLLLRLDRHVIGYPHEREWSAIPFASGHNNLPFIIVVNWRRTKPIVMCGCRYGKTRSPSFR